MAPKPLSEFNIKSLSSLYIFAIAVNKDKSEP